MVSARMEWGRSIAAASSKIVGELLELSRWM